MTTGEGGMAVTPEPELAERMRQMSLHGLSKDAWTRYSGGNTWDYRIVAPGYKYNLTDLAASIGIHQLKRAEAMRKQRSEIAAHYDQVFQRLLELERPYSDDSRLHAWHLYPIRLRLEKLGIDRNQFIQELRQRGIGCSVHWRPLHLHPYYEATFGWQPDLFPIATSEWQRLISLPLFPDMREDEIKHTVKSVTELCERHSVS